jgi:glycosyltransferase involved in cell wall biosynthesis
MYNEEETVPLLRRALESFATEVSCQTEVVLVNDGSRDATIELLIEWARADERIKVIHLSRNFGHQIAATAGLDRAGLPVLVSVADWLCSNFGGRSGELGRPLRPWLALHPAARVRAALRGNSAWVFSRICLHRDRPTL